MNNKSILVSVLALSLSACGGGGGGSSSGGGASPTFSLNTDSATLSENGKANFSISSTLSNPSYSVEVAVKDGDSSTKNYALNDFDSALSLAHTDNEIIISANDHSVLPNEYSINITVKENGQQFEVVTATLTFQNETAQPSVSKVKKLIENPSFSILAPELQEVEAAYTKVLDIKGIPYTAHVSDFDVDAYESALEDAEKVVMMGGAKEKDLTPVITALDTVISTEIAKHVTHVNGLTSLDNSLTFLEPLELNVFNDELSYFKGNTNYGQGVLAGFTSNTAERAWEFSSNYAFIGNLVDPNNNCSIAL